MTRYMPLLKAKPGEFEAYGTLAASAASGLLPLFEWVPDASLTKAVEKPTKDAQKFVPFGARVAVDCGALPQATLHGSPSVPIPIWVAQELQSNGIEMLPVVRLGDAHGVVATFAQIVSQMAIPEVALRLDSNTLGVPSVVAAQIHAMAKALGLGLHQIHLLLDFKQIFDHAAVTAATPNAVAAIGWAGTLGHWASITLAGGAFPAALGHLPPGASHLLPRFDAELWRSVVAAGHSVDFGDYAVNGTGMPSSAPFPPNPGLRYTAGRDWLIRREQKLLPGNQSFFTVAANVVAHPDYAGAAYSWGDGEIARCSSGVGGPGNASKWRAYGTSHHLTTVVDRLATLGEP